MQIASLPDKLLAPRFVSETLLFRKCSGIIMTALEHAELLPSVFKSRLHKPKCLGE